MRHEVKMEGYAFRIRPVTPLDAEFILSLRTHDFKRLKFVHRVKNNLSDQVDWINSYYERPDEYYWIIEKKVGGIPQGTISIYNWDFQSNSAEWGRWILKDDSLGAVESALLLYRVAFELLGLKFIYSITVAENARVVSFHNSVGARHVKTLEKYFVLDDVTYDAYQHEVSIDDFELVKNRLNPIAASIATKIERV
jgi:RimJ/RimL family protein N-acetyltransferase